MFFILLNTSCLRFLSVGDIYLNLPSITSLSFLVNWWFNMVS